MKRPDAEPGSPKLVEWVMTEELQECLVRSHAAIREPQRLIELNQQLQIYCADTLERMHVRARFGPCQEIKYPQDVN